MNSKYIKTKQNQKREAKFFGPFWVLYPVSKQAYKLKLSKRWKIHNVFHVLLLEQDITKKRWVDKKITKLEFEAGGSDKYEVEAIWDSAIYANKAEGYLPSFYYLIVWKRYCKKENTWEPSFAVYVMPRSRDLQSRDPPIRFLIFVSIQPLKLRNFTPLTEPLPNKQCYLIARLQRKTIYRSTPF